MTDLKANAPILDLITDGMHHLERIMYEDNMYV